MRKVKAMSTPCLSENRFYSIRDFFVLVFHVTWAEYFAINQYFVIEIKMTEPIYLDYGKNLSCQWLISMKQHIHIILIHRTCAATFCLQSIANPLLFGDGSCPSSR